MKLIYFLFILSCLCYGYSQNRNNIWCFGDSVGLNFNFNPPQVFSTALDARGSCASTSDTSGNLLLYVSTSSEPVTIGHLDASKSPASNRKWRFVDRPQLVS